MTLFGCFLALATLLANSVFGRNQSYFNRDDIYYAECVPLNQRRTYKYYGNESHFIVGTSKRERCATWSDASNHLMMKVNNHAPGKAWVYPDESITHNQCRNFDFTLKDKQGHEHVIMHLKLHSGPYPGPWCYKKKPSDSEHSQQFAQNRESIFAIMVILVVLIILLVIGFHVMKNLFGQRQKLKAPKVFDETPARSIGKPEVIKQSEELTTNISLDGKRLSVANMKPSSSSDDAISLSDKHQRPHERETAV